MADLAGMLASSDATAGSLLGGPTPGPVAAAPAPPAADPYADTHAILERVRAFREEFGKRELRDRFLRPMYRNLLFYRGIQWIKWEPGPGRWRPANIPRGVPTPVTNIFADTMDTVNAVFGRVEPTLNWRPGAPDEPDDRAAADVAARAIQVVEDEVKIRMVRQSLATWVGFTGGAFLETGYDPDPVWGERQVPVEACPACGHVQPPGAPTCEGPGCGQAGPLLPTQQRVPIGKMYTEVAPLFEMFFDPSITQFSKHRRLLREKCLSVDDAKARWKAIAESISPNVAGSAEESYMSALAIQGPALDERGTGRRDQALSGLLGSNRVTERWYWQLPDETYPEGLLAIVVGESALAYAKPLPYWARSQDGGQRYFLPFTWFPQKLVPGTFWPKTVADDIALKQSDRNRWESALMLCGMRMGMPIWTIPKQAGVTGLREGGGEAGAVVLYNDLGPGHGKPERVPGQPLPMAFVEWMHDIDAAVEKLAKCLTGDTEVPCLDGVTRTMRQMADEFPAGGTWVYGFDPKTQRIVPAQVEKAWNTGAKRCVRVQFCEGTHVDCSFDHPFLTWDRGYVQAEHLQPGDSIVPLNRRFHAERGYEQVYQPLTNKYEDVHRMVGHALYGVRRGDGAHVHHKDEDRRNNLPDNLEVLSESEHHRHHSQKWWDAKSEAAKRRRTDPMVAAMRHYWESLSLEQKSARNGAVWAQRTESERQAHRLAIKEALGRLTPEQKAAHKARTSQVRKAWWAQQTEAYRQTHGEKMRAARANHSVFSVEPLGECEVYDLQTSTHNFGLAAGVISSNTFDVLKGGRPAGVSAGIALQILQERGLSSYGPLFIMWEDAWAEWGSQAVEIFRLYCTEERLLRIKGRDGQWQVEKFIGADLQGNVDVIAEAGSSTPRSTLADRAEIEQLMAYHVVNPLEPEAQGKILDLYGKSNWLPSLTLDTKNAIMEDEAFRAIAALPIWQYAKPRDVQAIETAASYPEAVALMDTWAQNLAMMQGIQVPMPAPWPKVYPGLDGHPAHSREHGNFGKSESFRRFPPIIQAMVEKHKAYHDQLLIQQQAALQAGAQAQPQGGFMTSGQAQPLNGASSPQRMGGDYQELQNDVASGGATSV